MIDSEANGFIENASPTMSELAIVENAFKEDKFSMVSGLAMVESKTKVFV